MSWLSGLAATSSASSAAIRRTSLLGRSPSGKRRKSSCSRVVNVLAGAACTRPAHGFAMIVELEGDADHLGAGARGKRGRDRAVDAAGHGDDDSGIARGAAELKIDPHWSSV